MGGCKCEICTHAPTTVRRLRCRHKDAAPEPDLHTAGDVSWDWRTRLLPARAPALAAESEDTEEVRAPLRRLGYELPVLALLALLLLIGSAFRRD